MSTTALALTEAHRSQARPRSPHRAHSGSATLHLVPAPPQAARTDSRVRLRDQVGATTAEYATVTGCGVGFAAVLFKFLTSEGGQQLLKLIFSAIRALLPF